MSVPTEYSNDAQELKVAGLCDHIISYRPAAPTETC